MDDRPRPPAQAPGQPRRAADRPGCDGLGVGAGPDADPVGIVDIGSNSVRLVVYRGGARIPVPLFNEKAVCALGQGLGASGRLNPDGRALARAAVGRFVALGRAMGVSRLDVLATAAVRDAADGAAFAQELERDTGVRVQVLDGIEEAGRAAQGVQCAVPDAEGVVADLGGGSLDLVRIADHRFVDFASFPLGLLRLAEASDGGQPDLAERILDEALARQPWLAQAAGQTVYAVGGAWRALARVCMHRMGYPLHVLDNYTLSHTDARPLLDWVAATPVKQLAQVPRLSKKRAPMLPLAAVVLARLMVAVRPRRVVFSVYGVREGQFMQGLPADMQREDPLLASMTVMAREAGRFRQHGDEVADWMAPLFPAEPPELARLRLAACIIGDIFWNEHPDYRAEQAFHRVLRLPFMGLDHRDRAGLALAIYHRYTGDTDAALVGQAEALLDDPARVRRTRIIGAALRLAHTLSGGAPGVLHRTRLDRTPGGTLTLTVPAGDPLFDPRFVERRLDKLARVLDLAPAVAVASAE
ncbi:Ppx/GppA family phosphatase [Roseospira goensis]|uniref:Exopolyphosphatase/guanosine-5'-triphosphate, 3'-diphosphate pyrophosphatase n=1 Tax=Roseospira goensis TaxID=391922 RepID=A0A7W6S1U8_9PROT|nr:Ppx/GppA family phosphatase [Roseospira goensis]MBB4286629.1 exopolyphosphatase/guanosine-5'-triphosphate,3'-diphosphate pyrophosphatase [Roseospira goensis]